MRLPLKIAAAFKLSYLFSNPYTISRRFEGDYVYGETPLATVAQIRNAFSFGQTVLDLGCGTGKVAFYLHALGHTVIGIDHVPEFVFKAETIASRFSLQNIAFQCRDVLQVEFSEIDTIYMAGTCFPDELIEKLTPKLARSGAKVITVSEPLKGPFTVTGEIVGSFPWGEASIYSNELSSSSKDLAESATV